MPLTDLDKVNIKQVLVDSLCREPEISKIVVFGSFLVSDDPHDLDVAIFQNSSQDYLPLACFALSQNDARYREPYCLGYPPA